MENKAKNADINKNENNILTVIQETEILGKKIKIYGILEKPLFLANDVAEWIEHSQTSKMVKSVDEDEKLMGTLFLSGQNREACFLTEDGLYEVCMQSRKPIAKQMKKEIKKYLKQIRLTGGAVETNREAEFINAYFPSFTEETKLSMVQDLREQNENYKRKISELEPKAEQFDLYLNNAGTLSLNQVAKALKTKRNKMMEFLRHKKVFNLDNSPSSYYADKGYFEVKNFTYVIRHNKKFQIAVTRVTPKGQDFLYRYLTKHIDEYSAYDVDYTTRISKAA